MQISLARKPAGGVPVYRQIARQIRGEIEAARLRPGSRLPPIRSLAHQLGVNRDSVAQAYEELVAAGLPGSTVGRGTFVRTSSAAPPRPPEPFQPALSRLTERLLDFERSRPSFVTAGAAVPMHALIPDPALYPAAAFRRVLSRVLADGGPDL